jgi:hypothetical protein
MSSIAMSSPTNPPANPTGTAAPSSSTGTTSGSVTGGATTSGTPPPNEIVISEKPFPSDPNWLADLILDRTKANWPKWDWKINTVIDQRFYGNYLDGTFKCPDAMTHPKAAMIWNMNNHALRAFITEHISDNDYGIASSHSNAHDAYEAIHANHQNLGLLAQVNIIREALATIFVPNVPLSHTINDIVRLHTKFFKMGKIDPDQLLTILILNALSGHYSRLQTSINDLLQSPSTTSHDV